MKNKRGVSIMIGYVLLIVFAMVIGAVVYNLLKTYVPKDVPECPGSVSIFINDANQKEDFQLNLTITNNGLFDIAGYFIHATNSSSQEIATKDLSEFLKETNAKVVNGVVIFLGEDNPMKPNDKQSQIFELDGEIYSIEIIPVRFQEEDNKKRFISCGGSKIKEVVNVGAEVGECTPESTVTTCGTWICGTRTNNCENDVNCGTCSLGDCIEGTCVILGPIIFLSDNFEEYTYDSGLNLYQEMALNGWEVIDGYYNDVYLQDDSYSYDGKSLIIEDNSEVIASINTNGYEQIMLEYARRTRSIGTSDRLRIYWRVGDSGTWTNLENVRGDSWELKEWNLNGAENREEIQIRFFIDADNNDYGYLDNVMVNGTAIS